MKFTDDQVADIKAWTVKKLEDISDADSGVLGDYVLALLRTEGTDEAVRKHAKGELEDFLNENTETFLNDLFAKVAPHQLGSLEYFPPPSSPAVPAVTRPLRAHRLARNTPVAAPGQIGSATTARKRSYHEANEAAQDGIHSVNPKSTRASFRGRHGGRTSRAHQMPTASKIEPGMSMTAFSLPPIRPLGFSIADPNNAMASFKAAKAMFPFMGQMTGQGQSIPTPLGCFAKQKCRDYNAKGLCVRGSNCPYEHGFDHITAEAGYNLYDPIDAVVETNHFGSNHRPAPERRYFEEAPPKLSPRILSGLGIQASRPSVRHLNNSSQITIFVRKIPQENFDENQVRNFFVQFGTIAHVTLNEQTPSAVIQFVDHSSAAKAFDSPKPIFDNRFVQVNWYDPNFCRNGTTKGVTYDNPFRSGLSGDHSGEMTEEPFESEIDPAVIKAQQAIKQKEHEERLAQFKKVKDAKADLVRRKKHFLEKYGEDKAPVLTQSVEKGNSAPDTGGEPKKTQALREHLAKLEAEARKQGIDPDAMSMIDGPSDYSPFPSNGFVRGSRGRGKGFSRGSPIIRGRGGYYYNTYATNPGPAVKRLDHRPKSLLISTNHTAFDDEALRIALLRIGELENIQSFSKDPGSALGSLIVTFRERWQAEKVMTHLQARDGIPGIGKVVVRWTNVDENLASTSGSASTPKTEIEVESSDEDGDVDEKMAELTEDIQVGDVRREENLDVAGEDEWDLIT